MDESSFFLSQGRTSYLVWLIPNTSQACEARWVETQTTPNASGTSHQVSLSYWRPRRPAAGREVSTNIYWVGGCALFEQVPVHKCPSDNGVSFYVFTYSCRSESRRHEGMKCVVHFSPTFPSSTIVWRLCFLKKAREWHPLTVPSGVLSFKLAHSTQNQFFNQE